MKLAHTETKKKKESKETKDVDRKKQREKEKVLGKKDRVLMVREMKKRLLKKISEQCSESSSLKSKLNNIFEADEDIEKKKKRKKKKEGWEGLRRKLEAIGENTSEITDALIGLVPIREIKVGISDNGIKENERFSRVGWEEIESVTGNDINDNDANDYDDRVHYVTNENVLNVLEITKEIKHPRTPSPNIQSISVPTILNSVDFVDVPPDLASAPLKCDPPTGCRPPDKPEKGSDEFGKKVSKKSLKTATMLLAELPDVEKGNHIAEFDDKKEILTDEVTETEDQELKDKVSDQRLEKQKQKSTKEKITKTKTKTITINAAKEDKIEEDKVDKVG